jgi:hypothetical protein
MINGSELQAALKDSGMDVNFLTLKAMMYRADQDAERGAVETRVAGHGGRADDEGGHGGGPLQ